MTCNWRNAVKKLTGFALATLALIGATSSAWAAGDVAPERGGAHAVEVIVVTAKRLPPELIDVVVVTPKRPGAPVVVRTPPAMPIEMPRVEFAVADPPVVRL
jgi:hypothetical protein